MVCPDGPPAAGCLPVKKSDHKGPDNTQYQILLLIDCSLRLAPSFTGVAVASQILCISTTLNKREIDYAESIKTLHNIYLIVSIS